MADAHTRLKIGITGGIGSGKTTVCKIFETLGIPVYEADTKAKFLMDTDHELKAALTGYFGSDVYYDNGTLNRQLLADIIFNDKSSLKKVNSLVHPAVARNFDDWCARQTAPYVLEEAAIIFERNIAHRFAKVILVTAPEDIRIQRVVARDDVYPETVRIRMLNQWSDEKKKSLADYVIYNDNSRLLTHQVMDIHKKILEIV